MSISFDIIYGGGGIYFHSQQLQALTLHDLEDSTIACSNVPEYFNSLNEIDSLLEY